MNQRKHSLDFGKKEKVLNYATQTYQLSRPSKVGGGRFCNLLGLHPCRDAVMQNEI
jgi:hypothetical protein